MLVRQPLDLIAAFSAVFCKIIVTFLKIFSKIVQVEFACGAECHNSLARPRSEVDGDVMEQQWQQ